jgi:hypothetical protein
MEPAEVTAKDAQTCDVSAFAALAHFFDHLWKKPKS